MRQKPTHVDLCAGTGAGAVAFEAEGFQTIAFSEINPFCCKLLAQNFPRVRNYGDLRTMPAIPCDVVTAGFPCQPVADGGYKLGEADSRWLWKAVLDFVDRSRPDFFLGENVVGITNLLLAKCQDDLESIGYKSQAFDIPSCAVGLPSVERHVWIVSARQKIRRKRSGEKTHAHNLQIRKFPRRNQGELQRWNLPESRTVRSSKGIRERLYALGNSYPPPNRASVRPRHLPNPDN